MPFDVQAARSAGYSDAEIADEMAKDSAFDTAGARSAGYSDAEIIDELQGSPTLDIPAERPVDSPERRALVAELAERTASADKAGERLKREENIANIARVPLQGITTLADTFYGLPRSVANLPAEISNRAFGTQIPTFPPIRPRELDPRNTGEFISTALTSGIGGAVSGIGIGQPLLNATSQAARNIGGALVANPVLQGASALSGASAGEIARQSGAGPVGQMAANLAGSLAPGVALSAANRLASGLTRTPEAQRLLDQGVNLTPGQLNPSGRINQIEEGTQSIGFVGPAIAGGRQNARATFQRAAIQQSAAPGTTIRQADPSDMLDQAYRSYEPLYDAARGFPVRPAIVNANGPNLPLSRAFQQATSNRGILASADDRANVASFLDDQLTRPVRNSEDLLRLRSDVRARARLARQQSQPDRADLLDEADTAITRALESQLPQAPLASLRTADANYGNFKIVERAVARAKDRDFTPNDLSEAVAQGSRGSNLGDYARGGGGPLRQLASDARATLDARSPPTGARLLGLAPGAAALSIDPVTGLAVQGATTAGIVAGAATQTGRRLAAGATAPQRFVRNAINSQISDVPLALRQQIISSLARQSAVNPTSQIVRDMIGIPNQIDAGNLVVSPDQAQDEFRRGLLGQ